MVLVPYQPNSAIGDVYEMLNMVGGTVCMLLCELSDEGVIIRSRDSIQYTYRALPHADVPDVILPRMVEKSEPVRLVISKRKHLRKSGCGEELLRCIQECLA